MIFGKISVCFPTGDELDAAGPAWGLQATAIEWLTLYDIQVNIFQAAHIHGNRFGFGASRFAYAERRAAAVWAKHVLDNMMTKGVSRQAIFPFDNVEMAARREPQQITLAAADRAIAFQGGFRFDFHLIRDTSAVTTSFIVHGKFLS